MGVLEVVTCCVLGVLTLAVFRKDLLRLKDALVAFWTPRSRRRRKQDRCQRKECDKENKAPPSKQSPVKATNEMDKAVTKELKSFTETSTKVSEEREGFRIKSATVVPETKAFESFSSSKLEERPASKLPGPAVEPFPSFDALQPRPLTDVSASSKQEFASGDESGFSKTVVEKKHEVKGNVETSYMKKEQESLSKSSSDVHGLPDITMDTIDLNNLISETQKRLDSFKNTFKSGGGPENKLTPKTGSLPERGSLNSFEANDGSVTEVKKTEIVKSSTTTETKVLETKHVLRDPAIQKPDLTLLMQKTDLPSSKQDPAFSLPDLGFTSQSSESSTIKTDIPFGSCTVTKKKKMFSSSSFYEEPDSIYPTMEEQVKMAHKIASSLADDTNRKSKGSNMFYKRVKRSSNWVHEGPDPVSDESGSGTPEVQGVEPPTPDPSQVPFKPFKEPPKLKLFMDPRHPLDLTSLRSSGVSISEHNVVSPDVCHGLVKDLHSPVGKGAALFAKRKQKSEEWVVDEERIKNLLKEQESRKFQIHPPSVNQYSNFGRQDLKLIKSPWEAAMESPFGLCDSAFSRINPDHLADTVIRAADQKRAESLSRESSRMEGCVSPQPLTPAAATYDIYHAKAPKGWPGSASNVEHSPFVISTSMPAPASVPHQQGNIQIGFQPKKMVFQNFNTVPRCWKGTSVH